jgi:Zn-dependent peptidase ImmA (M78 family)
MARSIPSNATPAILKWARESANLSAEEVASAERISADRLRDWERGEGTPSLARLRKLAQRYRRPLAAFYLRERPEGFQVIRDFRLIPLGMREAHSPVLTFALRGSQERQAWAEEVLEAEGGEPVSFAGASIKNAASLGRALRAALGVPLATQLALANRSAALTVWRRAVEGLGVFVFQATRVPIEEMRGCALPGRFAPIAMINSKDSPAARIFTLIHELAHLVRGESAISGGEIVQDVRQLPEEEFFCNQVAAEVLAPESDFRPQVARDWMSDDDETIKQLANRYLVSRAFAVMRLRDLGLATPEYAYRKLLALNKPWTSPTGAVPQFRLALSRFGESFSRLAVAAFHEGTIHGGELTSLLSLGLKQLPKLEESLASGATLE